LAGVGRCEELQRPAGDRGGRPWTTVCRRCATDLDDGYVDESSGAKGGWYRVIPYNLGGRPGPASNPIEASMG